AICVLCPSKIGDPDRPADAGSLRITANRLVVEGSNPRKNSVVEVWTSGNGDAGHIAIHAGPAGSVEIGSGGAINANTVAAGNGGGVTIDAGSVEIGSGGAINANTVAAGNGGDVTIDADSVTLSSFGSIAAGTNGSGEGGNITINADSLAIRSGSYISSNTYGSGHGGAIQIPPTHTGDIPPGAATPPYPPR